MQNTLFILSLLALAGGPLLHRLAKGNTSALSGLDGFSFVAVGGLVLLHGVPDAFAHAGWSSLMALVVGFIGPSWAERSLHRSADQAHAAAKLLALLGLAAHAFVDGTALSQSNSQLALAIVLHRLPVSLAIWMILGPSHPRLRGAALLLIGMMTIVGFYIGGAVLGEAGVPVGLFEGLVCGSLLHVVVHRPVTSAGSLPRARSRGGFAGAGALLGLGLLYATIRLGVGEHDVLEAASHIHEQEIGEVFLALAAESAPALLLAYLGAGLLDEFMPRATVSWMRQGSSLSQSLRGVGFGLPLPVCSCGVIPLYRSLIMRGAPATAAMAFLIATPEIGVDAVLLSFPLLGTQMTLVRLATAAIVAVVCGWIVGGIADNSKLAIASDNATGETALDGSIWQRLTRAAHSGFGEAVDNTGPWILLGLAIAAAGAQLLHPQWLGSLPKPPSVLLFALCGIPSYVCATGATPLVAMLMFKGVSPGAAVAFLLTGPATNATTFGVLSQLHGRKTAFWFGLAVASMAVGLGLAIDAAVPAVNVYPMAAHAHGLSLAPLKIVSLLGLALLFLLSLVRQGPRHFIRHIVDLDIGPDSSDGGCAGHSPHGKSHCCEHAS